MSRQAPWRTDVVMKMWWCQSAGHGLPSIESCLLLPWPAAEIVDRFSCLLLLMMCIFMCPPSFSPRQPGSILRNQNSSSPSNITIHKWYLVKSFRARNNKILFSYHNESDTINKWLCLRVHILFLHNHFHDILQYHTVWRGSRLFLPMF